MENGDQFQESKSKYDCLLFDLDDTLYPFSSGLSNHVTENIQEYMLEKLGIQEDKVPELCVSLYKIYGTTMAGLKAIGYDFDYDDFHSFVHGRLPYNLLKPDPVLRGILLSLPFRKIIFTNADDAHAKRVLHRLGLEDCFERVISFETLNSFKSNNFNSPDTDSDYKQSSTGIFDFYEYICNPDADIVLPKTRVKFNVRSRSPGPASRGPTSPTSPLHPRLQALSLDSPTGKQDDGRSQCHPLPLPPGSPTSPSSALCNTRSSGPFENTTPNLSKWKKGKLLGRGTFGHVYLGFNSENGQMCAIKEVRVGCDDQNSKECLKQLNQEINLLNKLSHPNIVQYHGSEPGEESLSIYLEYVSGGSIHKLLQEYGPFKEPVIQNYTRQIVSGLAYLHGRNTVHRDIKGANILVDPNGEIKLADFGMAKHITSAASMLSFKGSPYWMAPEVVMNTNGYSLPVDIWSLGCTLIEMAASKPPWSQYEGVAAIFKIGNSKDMPEIPEHLSNDAKNFIMLCLQRDPLARPTAQKLLEHPFIRDQSATRAATRDVSSYMFDGSRTPPVLEPHSNRRSITSLDGDYATKSAIAAPRATRSPRDHTRMITSLPVSPSSSPLRQYGADHRSCFYSPPHPSYTTMGQNSYTLNDTPSYPVRSNATFTLDPWRHETSRYKAHTPPGGSPRMRFI